ncbi:MAG: inositol monophosphatase family protein, partial [Chloroflexota bacterium]
PGWCVSVGVLDRDLIPRAGIIFAPRLDLLIVADTGEHARVNGSPLPRRDLTDAVSPRSNLMVTSRIHKVLDLSGYIGKIRSIGSAALHLCYPLIYGPVVGALEGPGIHIWDMVAAHAVRLAEGDDLCYLGGDLINYGSMIDGTPGSDVVVAAHESVVPSLRAMLKRLPSTRKGSAGKEG